MVRFLDKDLGLNVWSIFIIVFIIIGYDTFRYQIPAQKQYHEHMQSATIQIDYLKTEIEIKNAEIRKLKAEVHPKTFDTIELPPKIKLVIKDSVINDTIVNVIWRFTRKDKIIDK